MAVRQRSFIFRAGVVILDFLNTEIASGGLPADLLSCPADLDDWLVEAKLSPRRSAMQASARALLEVKGLRRKLRALFLRLAAGHVATSRDLEPINAALRKASGRLVLESMGGKPRLRFVSEPGRAGDPLLLIARAAAEFLAEADVSLIRSCGGPDCILLFYDTTKSHTRRWCSMAACGNRSKAAQHYERSKSESR